MKTYKGMVLKGSRDGRKIGFPTVNLNPSIVPKTTKQGVYAAQVLYLNRMYKGALYYGPRLVKNEAKPVLEIHIISFNKDIYGESIEFSIGKFIRGIKNFRSMSLLKRQIEMDIDRIKEDEGLFNL